MAVGFIVSGLGGGSTTPTAPDVGQEILEPVPESVEDAEATEADAPATEVEDTTSAQ